MKKIKQVLLAGLVILSSVSCTKTTDEPTDTSEKQTISAKWIVNGTSEYESFEFNASGNYIVVKRDMTKSTKNQIVLFGTYETTDSKSISLSDFGTLKVSSIVDNTISLSLFLTGNSSAEIHLNASKQHALSSSPNTNLLCRTWELVSIGEIYVDGIVLFSEAGTYFISSLSGNDIGTWQWCNSAENKISFTLDDQLDCDGIETIREIELTSSSFVGIDTENGKDDELVMKPKSTTKSAFMSPKKINDKIFGYSF